MSAYRESRRVVGSMFETLENRRLMSASVSGASTSPVVLPLEIAPVVNQVADGQTFNGQVATFGGYTSSQIPFMTAEIHWGDGQRSVGVIQVGTNGNDIITVTGSHLYSTTNGSTLPVHVVLFEDATQSSPEIALASQDSAMTITGDEYDTRLIEQYNLQQFKGSLGHVDSTVLDDPTMESLVSVNWGDGTVTGGHTVLNADGTYRVVSNHIYTTPGIYLVQVQVAVGTKAPPGTVTPDVLLISAQFDTTIDADAPIAVILNPLPIANPGVFNTAAASADVTNSLLEG